MKIFVPAMLVLIAICGYFWATDAPDSGMDWATGIAALILVGVLGYKKWATGSWFSDSSAGR